MRRIDVALAQLAEAQQARRTPSPAEAVLAARWRIRKAMRLLAQD